MNYNTKRMKAKRRMAEDDEDEDKTTADESAKITSVNNDIFFYGSIDTDAIMKFNIVLKQKENELLKLGYEHGYEPEINVYIQSAGGDVYAGLSGI